MAGVTLRHRKPPAAFVNEPSQGAAAGAYRRTPKAAGVMAMRIMRTGARFCAGRIPPGSARGVMVGLDRLDPAIQAEVLQNTRRRQGSAAQR